MNIKEMLPIGFLINKIRQNPSLIDSYVYSKILYTVEIDPVFWSRQRTFEKLVKNGRKSVTLFQEYMDDTEVSFRLDTGLSNYADLIWYKNKPIIFRKEHMDSDDNRMANAVVLITLNIKSFKDNLKDFVNAVYKYGIINDKKVKYREINTVRAYDSDNAQTRPCSFDSKTFDDVFIPDEQYNAIVNGIDNFIKNKDFLNEHGIPSHYGILLYGTPGCGRTSIIKALIRKYNCTSYYLASLTELPALIKTFNSRFMSEHISFVICEDVDCTLFNRQKGFKKDDDRNNKAVSLSEVLNSIDGMCSPHNVVFVFTTNHIEELDPALIRPGRMDLKLEIKPICYETLNKFTMRYFNKPLPEDYVCREGELFSNLQLQVMGGASFEDILKFMKGA